MATMKTLVFTLILMAVGAAKAAPQAPPAPPAPAQQQPPPGAAEPAAPAADGQPAAPAAAPDTPTSPTSPMGPADTAAPADAAAPATPEGPATPPSNAEILGLPPLQTNPLFPEPLPEPATGTGAEFGEPEKMPGATAPSGPRARIRSRETSAEAEELARRIRFREVKTKADRDPQVGENRDAAAAARTDVEKREALRAYYNALCDRMLKIDSSLKEAVEAKRKLELGRLLPSKVRGAEGEALRPKEDQTPPAATPTPAPAAKQKAAPAATPTPAPAAAAKKKAAPAANR